MASFTDQLAKFFGMNDTDTSLRELFISELKGIYYAEKQFADAQPQMAEAATTDVVRDAFEQHRQETKNQINRLEQIFHSLGVSVDEKTCQAADGLVDDGQVVIAETDSGSLTRDAGLIIAGQKVEHHEIAAYGSLHSLARLLGYHDAARLLEESLQEEKNTDRKLTEIAESFINERAKMESDNDGSGDMRSGMRDTVRSGDYGTAGSSYSGTMSDADSDYASTVGGSTSGMNRGTSGNMMDDDMNYNRNVGSTGNTGYDTGMSSTDMDDLDSTRRSGSGTGSGMGSQSSGLSSDDDFDGGNDYTRRTGSGGTGGSSSGI